MPGWLVWSGDRYEALRLRAAAIAAKPSQANAAWSTALGQQEPIGARSSSPSRWYAENRAIERPVPGGGRSGQAAFKGCCWRLLPLSPEAMNDQDQPKGFVRSFAAAVCSGPVAYLPELARVSGPLFPSECMCSRLRATHLCLSRR